MATSVNELHETSEIRQVELSKLRVDKTYQREPSQALVNQIAENWDIVASELVLVSNRGERDPDSGVEGGEWLVNGQHRSLAAAQRGDETIWARVVDLSAEADPAAIEAAFRIKTNVGLGDRPAERFKAQLRAGDEESLAIVKILDKYDTEINLTPQPDTGINAVSCVEGIYRWDEGVLLDQTFSVIKQAYGVVGGKQCTSSLMKGLAWFLEKHADESLENRLVERIQNIGYAALDRRARASASTMSGTLWLNFYRVLVELYNDRLTEKSRLSWALKGVSAFGSNKQRTNFSSDSTF